MEAKTLLRANRLKKHFPVIRGLLFTKAVGHVKAVDGISFTIAESETLALVGESGCGKTTTAQLVLRLERPSDGEVLFDGKDVHALRGHEYLSYRHKVQAVFQDPWSSLNPRMRVRAIVAETLVASQKISKRRIREHVDKVLVDVGLNPAHASRYPHEFSGGQRQRIAVAAALVSDPKLIVLDEPVSALDVSIRAQIMNLLRDLQTQYNISYLLIAHDLASARYMAHRIAIMYLGKIVEYSPTEAVFDDPLHPYTQALFSAALPSHPDMQREEIILHGEVPSPIDPPPGCAFHPRCPKSMGRICEQETPVLCQQGGSGRWVSCHLYPENPQQTGTSTKR